MGGEAKRNETLVDGHRIVGPQGSDDFGIPEVTGQPDDYFTSLGIPRAFDYKKPTGAAEGLEIPLDHFSYMHWKQSAFATGHFFDDAPREPNALFPDLPTTPSHLLRVPGKKAGRWIPGRRIWIPTSCANGASLPRKTITAARSSAHGSMG